MNPRLDDLIALAALGELTDEEAQELDRAAQADPLVASELADALAGAAMLQSTAVESPPAALKRSVMDAIAGVDQDAAAPAGPPVRRDRVEPVEQAITVRAIDSAPSRRRVAPWIAAAAVALVVGVVAVLGGGDDTDPDGRSAEIAAVLDAADAQPHSVAGEIGELEFVYSPSQQAFVLVADALEPPPEGSTSQVWLVTEDAQTSLGTFEPDEDGDMEMRADGIDPTGATIGITTEPAGGSATPTAPMVAASVD